MAWPKAGKFCIATFVGAMVLAYVVAVSAGVTVTGQPVPDSQPVSSLYARIEGKLARRTELAKIAGIAPTELAGARWLLGTWSVKSRVFAKSSAFVPGGKSIVEPIMDGTWLQIRDSYADEVEDLGFLTFNVVTKEWVVIGLDRTGNAITAKGIGWERNRLVLTAHDAEIVGERVVLRQTLPKVSDQEYRVLNEERLDDGSWALIDEYVYTRD